MAEVTQCNQPHAPTMMSAMMFGELLQHFTCAWTLIAFVASCNPQATPVAPLFKSVPSHSEKRVRAAAAGWVQLPDGNTAAVIRFDIEPGWHMYWENPGDSGAPLTAQLQPIAGWTTSEPIYPRPTILNSPNEINFIYLNAWELIVPLVGSPGISAPSCIFDVSWMVCKERCEIGRASVVFPAAVGVLPPLGTSRLGRSIPTINSVSVFNAQSNSVTISAVGVNAKIAQLIPCVTPGVNIKSTLPVPLPVVDAKISVAVPLDIHPENALNKALMFKGLLLQGSADSEPCQTIRLVVNASTTTN